MAHHFFVSQQHISRQFNAELQNIHSSVLRMGGMVQQQLRDALHALSVNDALQAENVAKRDYKINQMEMLIDTQCRQVLVRRQPTAIDLRLILTAIKTITDLERIGDEAKRIARMAQHYANESVSVTRPVDITHLSDQVQGLLNRALDSFARMDADSALHILCEEDQPIDQEYERLTRQLVAYMMTQPRDIPQALDILWSSRALERIGDRACNLCEYIIYYVHGRDIRHSHLQANNRQDDEENNSPAH